MIALVLLMAICIVALVIIQSLALQEAAAWKHEAERHISKWLDAEDRATAAEFKLLDYQRRDRHVGIVYELALDDVQNHPRRADDYNWNWN